ncbi:unnamed protein product [Adineta ricciae]|uniref:Uncharacterized protein n=1 Tax=Adineta ricciae TaxID=249248 RepID=A0A813N090_ADIRI|nr:unnamed protein product [Adineta ricciae]
MESHDKSNHHVTKKFSDQLMSLYTLKHFQEIVFIRDHSFICFATEQRKRHFTSIYNETEIHWIATTVSIIV